MKKMTKMFLVFGCGLGIVAVVKLCMVSQVFASFAHEAPREEVVINDEDYTRELQDDPPVFKLDELEDLRFMTNALTSRGVKNSFLREALQFQLYGAIQNDDEKMVGELIKKFVEVYRQDFSWNADFGWPKGLPIFEVRTLNKQGRQIKLIVNVLNYATRKNNAAMLYSLLSPLSIDDAFKLIAFEDSSSYSPEKLARELHKVVDVAAWFGPYIKRRLTLHDEKQDEKQPA